MLSTVMPCVSCLAKERVGSGEEAEKKVNRTCTGYQGLKVHNWDIHKGTRPEGTS